jgi:hypothetical protein
MVLPSSGLFDSTSISTVYSRASSNWLSTDCRSGNSRRPNRTVKPMVSSSVGTPTQAISNKPRPGLIGFLQQQAVDHQVGAGADQGTGAAGDGGVAQRHHQLRDGDAVPLGPVLHRRDEHRHHRRVVEEGAQRRHRRHQPRLGMRHRARSAQQRLRHPGGAAGFLQAGHHHVEHRHGHHAFVGQPGQRLAGLSTPVSSSNVRPPSITRRKVSGCSPTGRCTARSRPRSAMLQTPCWIPFNLETVVGRARRCV